MDISQRKPEGIPSVNIWICIIILIIIYASSPQNWGKDLENLAIDDLTLKGSCSCDKREKKETKSWCFFMALISHWKGKRWSWWALKYRQTCQSDVVSLVHVKLIAHVKIKCSNHCMWPHKILQDSKINFSAPNYKFYLLTQALRNNELLANRLKTSIFIINTFIFDWRSLSNVKLKMLCLLKTTVNKTNVLRKLQIIF